MSQLLLYSNSDKNVHLICIYRVVVSVWVVCLFCFYRKNVVPRCPSLDVASLNAFMGSGINGRGAFPLWEPSWHSDSFGLPVLTFNFQTVFSPLWLHLARPDSWFYLVLSLADLTFWSHGSKSSKGAWAEWLWAVKTVHPSWGWSWGHAEKTHCFIFRTGERAATESGGSS